MELSVLLTVSGELPVVTHDASNGAFHERKFRDNYLKLSKREAYPHFYFEQVGDSVRFGYGKKDRAIAQDPSEEYLRLEYDAGSNELSVERDELCTWPIFFYADETVCALSGSLESLLKMVHSAGVTLQVDEDALQNLFVHMNIDEKTLLRGVELLLPSTHFTWANGKYSLSIRDASTAVHNGSSRPEEFKKIFEDTITNYFDKVAPDADRLFFEWSGGIDSSSAPLLLHDKFGFRPKVASISYLEGYGTTQNEKYDAFRKHTDSALTSAQLFLEKHYPLSRYVSNGKVAAFYQYQEIYTEILVELAQNISTKGAMYIFTGIGGDELFENHADRADDISAYSPAEDCLGDRLRSNSFEKATHKHSFSVSESALFANQSRNSIYIENGIWPIAPLADPRLYAFCQNLPILSRANKNILRALHEAYRWPDVIYNPVQNEHFGRFFDDSMKKAYKNRFKDLINQSSFLAKQNFIDVDKVHEVFDRGLYSESASAELFFIFRVLTAEIVLSSYFESNH